MYLALPTRQQVGSFAYLMDFSLYGRTHPGGAAPAALPPGQGTPHRCQRQTACHSRLLRDGATGPPVCPTGNPHVQQRLQTHDGLLRRSPSDLPPNRLSSAERLRKRILTLPKAAAWFVLKSWFNGKEISFGNTARRAIKLTTLSQH